MWMWVDVWSTLSRVFRLYENKRQSFFFLLSLLCHCAKEHWSIIKNDRTINGNQSATDNLFDANNRLMSSRSDILFENARRLAVPFLLKSHIYPRVCIVRVGNLICIVFDHVFFFAEKCTSTTTGPSQMTNTNYTLAISHKTVRTATERRERVDGRATETETRENKICCENTNYTIMDIDPFTKKRRENRIENIVAENWHCSRNERRTTNKLSNTQKNRKRIYICLIIVS